MWRNWRSSLAIDWPSALRAVLTGTAVAFLLTHIGVGLLRVFWPIPLDDLELAVIAHVQRAAAGLPLYITPRLDFVPLVYPPLFYHVAGWFWTSLGSGFPAVRLVSFVASAASIGLVALIVRYETGSWRAALLAAGLRSAVSGEIGWLSLARVDSLMLVLVLAGTCSLRVARSSAAAAAAGVFFGLAVLTKQPAVFTFAALTVWQAMVDWRRAVALVSGFLAAVAAIGGAWQWESHGWFSYYVLHVSVNQRAGDLLGTLRGIEMLFELLPFAVLASCLMPLRVVRESLSIDRDTARFWMSATIGGAIACFGSKLIHGTDMNALLPVCSYLIVQLAIYVESLVRLTRRRAIPAIELTATAVVLAQFVLTAYVPAQLLPESLDERAKWVVHVSTGQGDRLERRRLHWSALDPARHADSQAVTDLLSGGTPRVAEAFLRKIRQAYCRPQPADPVDIDEDLLRAGSGVFPAGASTCTTTASP
jgi:4-amino-4-deoxy-L-arabinose transferase-like glycosyltransferase